MTARKTSRRAVLASLAAAPVAGLPTADIGNGAERPATVEELAAVDFEPLTGTDHEAAKTPDQKGFLSHLQTLRVAWVILGKSKPELMGVLAKIDDETGRDLFEGFVGTIEELERLLSIMRTAEIRILCAGAALELMET